MKASHFTGGETEAQRDCPYSGVSCDVCGCSVALVDHPAAFRPRLWGGVWSWAVGEKFDAETQTAQCCVG